MNIVKIQNTSNILFRGYRGTVKQVESNNKADDCINDSSFMRNLDSLGFVCDYLKKEFPKGANIADFACSNGDETYSLGILLHDCNKDKKYKITGYDISTKAIEDAEKGFLSLSYNYDGVVARVLTKDRYVSRLGQDNENWLKIKSNFNECFQKLGWDWEKFNLQHPRAKKKVTKLPCASGDAEIDLARVKFIQTQNNFVKAGDYFVPKKGVFDDVIDFKLADIVNIDKELTPNKTGVVFFKNALYHLMYQIKDDKYLVDFDIKPVKELFSKIYSMLSDKGIFVMGALNADHLFGRAVTADYFHKINQDGKELTVYDTSFVHQELREAGFEPIFYEQDEKTVNDYLSPKVYLPSVWRKLSEEEIYQREQEQKKEKYAQIISLLT
ncbi:MAG TPA: CheR family methyltransferase [Candidatus Gastranaerophilaceae bacterium]|nr:CheR family methyltransferase [Candidatus Gastranaerophilaceae bacterium]HPT41476.1 CheR family methyltransferase [Candidatus Gastranaerophilaceae bacterium]